MINKLLSATRSRKQILTVKNVSRMTKSMIRVTFNHPNIDGITRDQQGGNCKLTLPDPGMSLENFRAAIERRNTLAVRTYTVRYVREEMSEIDIDFVDHGDNGPASAWAIAAKPGSFLGFMGPSPAKVRHFDADWYFLAADPSALPLLGATLESMPRNARGVAILEVTSIDDRQDIDAPPGIEFHWIVHPDPHTISNQQVRLAESIAWPEGRVQVCVAGESSTVKALRQFLLNEKGIDKKSAYISGYWKIGLVEPEHQKFKKSIF